MNDVYELLKCAFHWFHFRAGREAINTLRGRLEAVDCHIGDLQTSHAATQLSVMIGNHTRLSWLPVRVHLASKSPPLDDVVLL